jgi:serine/threonine protein kinase
VRSSTLDLEKVGDILGEGRYGVVKKRLDKSTGEARAVKLAKRHEHWDSARLVREAEVLERLDHPYILRISGWHQSPDNANPESMSMVTEFCEGGELQDAIKRIRKEGEERIHLGWLTMVFRQLFGAIAYCHDRGLIHRDIKKHNIMLMHAPSTVMDLYKTTPHVVLVDFGLAQVVDPRSSGFNLFSKANDDNLVAGTPGTIAPEVWKGK